MRAIGRGSVQHSAGKISQAPGTKPMSRIGRDVGRDKSSKIRFEVPAAGKRQRILRTLGLVAGRAATGPEHRLSTQGIAREPSEPGRINLLWARDEQARRKCDKPDQDDVSNISAQGP